MKTLYILLLLTLWPVNLTWAQGNQVDNPYPLYSHIQVCDTIWEEVLVRDDFYNSHSEPRIVSIDCWDSVIATTPKPFYLTEEEHKVFTDNLERLTVLVDKMESLLILWGDTCVGPTIISPAAGVIDAR